MVPVKVMKFVKRNKLYKNLKNSLSKDRFAKLRQIVKKKLILRKEILLMRLPCFTSVTYPPSFSSSTNLHYIFLRHCITIIITTRITMIYHLHILSPLPAFNLLSLNALPNPNHIYCCTVSLIHTHYYFYYNK